MSTAWSRIEGPQPGEPKLHVTLLGPPEVRQTTPVLLPRRQTRALLYRLAASQQPVARDELGHLLAAQATRRSVTVVLNQLRSALPCPQAIVLHDDSIGLDRRLVSTDIATFEAFTGGAQPLDRLAAALPLYRGPFLDSFLLNTTAAWDDWMLAQRRHWERRYLDALVSLADRHTQRRDYAAAKAAVQCYLDVDPLEEAMHSRLMALYAAMGDRAAALKQFERCVVLLERELGEEPQPETRAMYEAVRTGHIPLANNPAGETSGDGVRGVVHRPGAPEQPAHGKRAPLPTPATPLLGRAGELHATAALLQTHTRLLTLCGPGGMGKTRLALQLASMLAPAYRDGVVWVALASIDEVELVAGTIVNTLGLAANGALTPETLLRMFLRDKQLLLVLDNLEHLPGAAPLLGELLAAAPELRILAASRTALKLQAEQLYPVPPLPLPSSTELSPAELARQPAIALLVARARQQQPDFQLTVHNAAQLAAICVRLDGMPLAIELAAARLKLLSPRELLRRLDRQLDLLDCGPRDAPQRSRTLRATIQWSERLLDRRARRCFAALSVFNGGWSAQAAAAVLDVPAADSRTLHGQLDALHGANLITADPAPCDAQRFDMLETMRQFAAERLQSHGDVAAVRHKHALYFAEFAAAQAPRLHGPASAEALHELDRDYSNIRAALGRLFEAGAVVQAARAVSALQWYWDIRGLLEEARAWHDRLHAHAQCLPGPLSSRIGAEAAFLAYRRGAAAEAEQLAATVTAGAQAETETIVDALCTQGLVAMQRADYRRAQERFKQALRLARRDGLVYAVADAQTNLGMLRLVQGRLRDAESCLHHTYRQFAKLQRVRQMGSTLAALGYIAVLDGNIEPATRMLCQAVEQLRVVREIPYLLYVLRAFADLAALRGRPALAATLRTAATTHAQIIGLRFLPGTRAGALETAAGDMAGALEQAVQRGASLSVDDALALALELDERSAG